MVLYFLYSFIKVSGEGVSSVCLFKVFHSLRCSSRLYMSSIETLCFIAKKYNVNPTTIFHKLKKHPEYKKLVETHKDRGLKYPKNPIPIEEVMEDYKNGHTLTDIRKKHGLSYKTLERAIYSHPDYKKYKHVRYHPKSTILKSKLQIVASTGKTELPLRKIYLQNIKKELQQKSYQKSIM